MVLSLDRLRTVLSHDHAISNITFYYNEINYINITIFTFIIWIYAPLNMSASLLQIKYKVFHFQLIGFTHHIIPFFLSKRLVVIPSYWTNHWCIRNVFGVNEVLRWLDTYLTDRFKDITQICSAVWQKSVYHEINQVCQSERKVDLC